MPKPCFSPVFYTVADFARPAENHLENLALQRIQRRPFEKRPDLGTVFEIIAAAGQNILKECTHDFAGVSLFPLWQQRCKDVMPILNEQASCTKPSKRMVPRVSDSV